MISISVVSHGQFSLIKNLLDDLELYCRSSNIELILTLNLPEVIDIDGYSFPVTLIRNAFVKGFGENHNAAFAVANGNYFCVVNPDIRLSNNVFDFLLPFHILHKAGISAPVVMSPQGGVEDSARSFPSPLGIALKAMGLSKAKVVVQSNTPYLEQTDWVAGMFMLFSAFDYDHIDGFDERYFLYYEDVDICARFKLKGMSVLVCPTAAVIHDAQRSSHKSFKYFRWHLTSMLRFFLSLNYLRLLCR